MVNKKRWKTKDKIAKAELRISLLVNFGTIFWIIVHSTFCSILLPYIMSILESHRGIDHRH